VIDLKRLNAVNVVINFFHHPTAHSCTFSDNKHNMIFRQKKWRFPTNISLRPTNDPKHRHYCKVFTVVYHCFDLELSLKVISADKILQGKYLENTANNVYETNCNQRAIGRAYISVKMSLPRRAAGALTLTPITLFVTYKKN